MPYKHIDNLACALCSTLCLEPMWRLPSCLPLLSNSVHILLSGEIMEMIRVNSLKEFLNPHVSFYYLNSLSLHCQSSKFSPSIKSSRKAGFRTFWFHYLSKSDTFHYMTFLLTNFMRPLFRFSGHKQVTLFCKIKAPSFSYLHWS